jgi:hypothetical protein
MSFNIDPQHTDRTSLCVIQQESLLGLELASFKLFSVVWMRCQFWDMTVHYCVQVCPRTHG